MPFPVRSRSLALRYCLTVDPTGILPGASNEHDGVGLLALRSVVSIPSMHAVLTRNNVAFADELRTFERAVQEVTIYGVRSSKRSSNGEAPIRRGGLPFS